MESLALIPAADSIPAAPWLFRILLDATFAVHLLFMNVMLGLTVLGLARSFGHKRGLGQQAGLVPNMTALAVNLGVAPLLFLQVLYGQFLYVSSTIMGVYWFGLVLAVMGAYGLAYRQKYALHAGKGPGTLAWALMTILMLYATLAQTHNAVLLVRPDLWQGYFDRPDGLVTAWGDPTLIPRWLHFVFASVALGGMALAMIGLRRTRHHDPHGAELTAEGLNWFAWASLAQMGAGLWWLVALPQPVMLMLMGGNPAATAHLGAGVAAGLAAVGLAFKGRLMPSAGALVVTVVLMVSLRGMLRKIYLEPYFDTAGLPVKPEPSTLAMFLGCVVLALAVVIWAARHPKADPKGAR